MMSMSHRLFVVSSPSGGGKNTVIQALMNEDLNLTYSVSMTTRPPRGNEKHGEAYWFADVETFQRHIEEGAFLEWAQVHDNYYGTLKATVQKQLAAGHHVIMDIDVQGGLIVKSKMPEAVLIFIEPPSLEVLEQRLRARGTDDEATIQTRLKNAVGEMDVAPQYDHRVVNDDLGDTVNAFKKIIHSYR